MSTGPASSSAAPRIWAALALLALLYFLYLVREILLPFLIAYFAAALLDPLLDRMQRRGWSRGLAALVVFAIFLLIFTGVALVIIPTAVHQTTEFVANVPAYYTALMDQLQMTLGAQQDLLRRFNLPTTSDEILARYQAQITRVLQNLLSRLLQFFAGSVSGLAWLALIPLITFYMLLEIDPLRARVVHLVPAAHRSRFLELAERIGAVFSGYVRGLIIVCAGYGVVTGVVLALAFRLPYALMIGLISALLYAVPYVGALAIVAVGGLVAFAANSAPGFVITVVATLIVINQLFDQFIYPRVVGGQAGLHPLASIFALTAGGQLFGLWGMILAVSVAASIQVVLVTVWPQLAEPLTELESGAKQETPPVPASAVAAAVDEGARGEAGRPAETVGSPNG